MEKNDQNAKLKTIVRALDDKKGVNIMAFHVEDESCYTDYLLFVTGTSTQHNKAMADFTVRELKNGGYKRAMTEGEQSMKWILIDSGEVVVHVMLEELRVFYDLESIWAKSPRVNIQELLKG